MPDLHYISLQGLSTLANKDPRLVARELKRLGIDPDATLEQEKRTQPLFEFNRVEAIAKLLMVSWRKTQTTKQLEDRK